MPLRSLAIVAAVMVPGAITSPAPAHPVFDLNVYCKRLVSFYDRYGASRTENSDGSRNHMRIGAEIDCKRGNPRDGVAAMIELLENKRSRCQRQRRRHRLPPANEKGMMARIAFCLVFLTDLSVARTAAAPGH